MRPTTGPTAFVDDLVGTFVPTGRRPHLDAAYAEGRIVREGDPEWRDDVPVRVETIPVRRGGRVIAVVGPQHQPARRPHPQPAGAVLPPDRGRPDPDDRRPATSRCPASAATTPTPRGWATGSCGSTQQGRVVYASPNALSVYRRLGLLRRPRRVAADRGDPASWCRRGCDPTRRRSARCSAAGPTADAEIGDASRSRSSSGRSRCARGAADRGAGAGPRRHRAASARPRAGHQGRDDPRDPPPGEEQPADRGRAAAPPGPPDGQRRRQGRARGGGTPGRARSRSCTRR